MKTTATDDLNRRGAEMADGVLDQRQRRRELRQDVFYELRGALASVAPAAGVWPRKGATVTQGHEYRCASYERPHRGM
jgi:hypothetical protein